MADTSAFTAFLDDIHAQESARRSRQRQQELDRLRGGIDLQAILQRLLAKGDTISPQQALPGSRASGIEAISRGLRPLRVAVPQRRIPAIGLHQPGGIQTLNAAPGRPGIKPKAPARGGPQLGELEQALSAMNKPGPLAKVKRVQDIAKGSPGFLQSLIGGIDRPLGEAITQFGLSLAGGKPGLSGVVDAAQAGFDRFVGVEQRLAKRAAANREAVREDEKLNLDKFKAKNAERQINANIDQINSNIANTNPLFKVVASDGMFFTIFKNGDVKIALDPRSDKGIPLDATDAQAFELMKSVLSNDTLFDVSLEDLPDFIRDIVEGVRSGVKSKKSGGKKVVDLGKV